MKILVNGVNLVVGGGVQVARALIIEFDRRRSEVDFRFLVSRELAAVLPEDIKRISVCPSPSRIFEAPASLAALRRAERQFRPDVILSVFGPTYWKPRTVHVCGLADSWVIASNTHSWASLTPKRRLVFYLKSALKRQALKFEDADAYILETGAMAAALQKLMPGKTVHVVPNNCGQSFFSRNGRRSQVGSETVLPAKQPDEVRVVTLSQYYPHKRLELIPHIARELRRRCRHRRFVFYLSLDEGNPYWLKINEIARKLRVTDSLVTIGSVSPVKAPDFYNSANIMLLPTLLESFSANYPEAMIMEVPIVTSDLPFARSICQEAALYFQPDNASDAAEKILQLVEDKRLKDKIVTVGRRVQKTLPTPSQKAQIYMDICIKTAGMGERN